VLGDIGFSIINPQISECRFPVTMAEILADERTSFNTRKNRIIFLLGSPSFRSANRAVVFVIGELAHREVFIPLGSFGLSIVARTR